MSQFSNPRKMRNKRIQDWMSTIDSNMVYIQNLLEKNDIENIDFDKAHKFILRQFKLIYVIKLVLEKRALLQGFQKPKN